DDLAHACLDRRLHEDAGVRDRAVEVEARMREADPVRVVKGVRAAQRDDEPLAVLELQRLDLELRLEVVGSGSVGMVGEGADPAAVRQQAPGDEPARVAEPAGDDVDARLAQAVVTSIKKGSESGRRQATPASRGPR